MVRRQLSAQQRRSRAALRWCLGIFVLVQLAAGVLLDLRGLAIRFPSAAQTLDRLDSEATPVDIVCLGSSRFLHGLGDDDLESALKKRLPGRALNVFNAAVPAGDQISSELMLNQLLRHGVRPMLAVIEVTPESLNHYNTWLAMHVPRQLGWTDLPAYLPDICYARQFVNLLRARFLPLYVHRKYLLQEGMAEANHLWGRWFPQGSPAAPRESLLDGLLRVMAETSAGPLERTSKGVAQVHVWLRHYHVGGTAAAALDRLLDRCEENGIRVILVRPPLTVAHREEYTPAIESEFEDHMHHLVAAHSCPFADYSDRLGDELFLDNHHLLLEGGRVFSDLLAREVLAAEVGRLASK